MVGRAVGEGGIAQGGWEREEASEADTAPGKTSIRGAGGGGGRAAHGGGNHIITVIINPAFIERLLSVSGWDLQDWSPLFSPCRRPVSWAPLLYLFYRRKRRGSEKGPQGLRV